MGGHRPSPLGRQMKRSGVHQPFASEGGHATFANEKRKGSVSISAQQLLDAQNWRYAVKKFDPNRKINPKDWEALEKSLILSPSSYGLQPWKFWVIQDSEIRKKLTLASWNQKQVEDCSHYVVFTGKVKITEEDLNRLIEYTSQARGSDPKKMDGYKSVMMGDLVTGSRSKWISEWVARQCYIALGNLMTSAALMGIDTCPMEGMEPAKYDEILGLKDSDYKTLVACAVGYRSTEDRYAQAKKVRYPAKEMIVKV